MKSPVRLLCVPALASVLAFVGCARLGGVRYLQGDSTVVGIGFPVEGDTIQLQAYSGLSGQKLEVDRNAAVTIDCVTARTNSYFGVVRSESFYSMRASIAPSTPLPEAEQAESP